MGSAELHPRIVAALAGSADRAAAERDRTFHPDAAGSYGLRTPRLRAILRGFRAEVRALAPPHRFELAQALAASGIQEEAHAGVWVLGTMTGTLGAPDFDQLDRFMAQARGWATVDDFTYTITQPLLQRIPGETIELLREWNASPNPWKRRSSVVGFTRKIAESGRFVDLTLDLCEALVWDGDDLVRKGVGWALKDTLRADKPRVLAYVADLRRRGVSAVIALYAIRDLRGPEREAILSIKPERSEAR